jgi:hypothetical protein
MALYLDEVWLKDPSPERMKEFVGLIGSAAKNPASVGAPQEVRFAGGPWFSNEEPKVIFLVDIPDHTPGPAQERSDRGPKSSRCTHPD